MGVHAKLHPSLTTEYYDFQNLGFLAIIELEKFKPQHIRRLKNLLDIYRSQPAECYSFISRTRSLETLLIHAEKAVSEFRALGLVDLSLANSLKKSIRLVDSFAKEQKPVLCHGDVSDNNLYFSGDCALLLDWEDCFWGFSGFDEIYYLTFLSNRFMINKSSMKESGLEVDVAKATYNLVVTLKEFLHLNTNQGLRRYSLIDRLNFCDF